MRNYNDYELTALLDLLVSQTAKYTNMMSDGTHSVEEISQCKHSLREIQGAILLKQGKTTEYILEPIKSHNSPNISGSNS